MTLLLYGLLAVVAVVGLYGLAMLVLPSGEQLAPPAPDIRPWVLAERPLVADDVVTVRLPVGLRGYRFAETDLLLDRLTDELRLRDAEIAELRDQLDGAVKPSGAHAWAPPSVAEPSAAEPDAAQAVPVPEPLADPPPSIWQPPTQLPEPPKNG